MFVDACRGAEMDHVNHGERKVAVDSMGIVVDKSVAAVTRDTHKALGVVEDLEERRVQGQVQVRQQKQLVLTRKRQVKPHLRHVAAVTP